MEWVSSEHEFIRLMARPMKEKFDKYWGESCLILAMAVVLDPRYKMAYVEYFNNRIYGSLANGYISRVRGCFLELFHEYGGDSTKGACEDVGDGTSSSSFSSPHNSRGDVDFDNWLFQTNSLNISAFQKSKVE